MLVDDADAAAIDGSSSAHALQLDPFRGGVEDFNENDAEFASFELVDVGDHGGKLWLELILADGGKFFYKI